MFTRSPAPRSLPVSDPCFLSKEWRLYVAQYVAASLASANLGVALEDLVELDEPVLYLDSVRYLLPRRTPFRLRQRLRSQISKKMLGKYHPGVGKGAEWERGYQLNMHQPKFEVLPWADERVRRRGGRVLGFDVSVDFVPRLESAVPMLRNWILARATLFRSRVATPVNNYCDTIYFNREHRRTNLALYSHKPSKIRKRPCVHLELRIRLSRALKGLGILWAADIANLNLSETFKHYVRLKEPDVQSLGRHTRGRGRAKKADYGYVGGMPCAGERAARAGAVRRVHAGRAARA